MPDQFSTVSPAIELTNQRLWKKSLDASAKGKASLVTRALFFTADKFDPIGITLDRQHLIAAESASMHRRRAASMTKRMSA